MEEDLPGLRGFRAAEDPDAAAAYDSVYPRELSELYPQSHGAEMEAINKDAGQGPRVCKN